MSMSVISCGRSALAQLAIVFLLLSCGSNSFGDSSTSTQRVVTRLAEGVYEIRHPDAPDGFPQSNTSVIVGERGVLVVDTGLLPSTAREDIKQIKEWTNKPVTYIVNTHWHFDHTLGNAEYAAAFPNVQIIAHVATQKIIAAFNPGAIERYPTRAERFRKILDSGKDPDGKPLTEGDRKDYQKALDGLASVVAEMKTASQVIPNVSFDSALNVDLGKRRVEIKFLGRGNTAGDTVVYLPGEKILCTGDLLDHPVPYLYGGLPTEQAATLGRMVELDATTIVPGHGDVQHDKSYIHLMIDLLNAVNASVEQAINLGKTVEETQAFVSKDVNEASWRQKFTGANKEDGDAFDGTFSSLVKNSYNLVKAR
jgi:cyclase